MKYLKIEIKNPVEGISEARKSGKPTMIYPEGYNNINFNHVGYVKDKNTGITYVLGSCDKSQDSIITNLLKDSTVKEITKEEAVLFSENNQERIEIYSDEVKVRRLEIKVNSGESLTVEDQKALDPDDPTPGITRSKILADNFNEE